MFKSRIFRDGDAPPRDSESEGTPLLSSGSRTSLEAATLLFDDYSETSDLDESPNGRSFKYGSIDAASYSTTLTTIPKRPIVLLGNGEPLVSATASPLCTFVHGRNYNIDLVSASEKPNATSNYASVLGGDFKPESLQFQPDIVQAACKDLKPKQSSLVTIFSVCNTILGSSLLTMSWGIEMAGIFPGIIIILAMSGLCLYTAYRFLTVHRYHGGGENIEVSELSRIYLHKSAEYIANIFSITVLLGATISYWILMTNFLYNSVNFIYGNVVNWSIQTVPENISRAEVLCPKQTMLNSTIIIHEKTYDALGPAWDLHATVPVFLALLIFPFLNFNNTTFFTKFNSLGIISVIYLFVFVLIKSISWGINMDPVEWEISWKIKSTFPALTGMLSMSFFIHNIIISIMQSNRNQDKNGRDLIIAYILVTLTYLIIGTAFYLCFPLPKSCIEDNFLNNFQKWDGLALGVRIVLFFQLLTVYPLIAYMLRVQLLSSIFKRACNRSLTLVINLILVLICILFATFVPYIGTITRYTGALSGLIYVFALPNLLHLSIMKKQGKLTLCSLLVHSSIPVVGVLNLVAQFFITEQ